MRKLLLASVAILSLGSTLPALAQDSGVGAAVAGSAGGAAGATAGFLLGGPVGAVIGGFTGAVLGASAGVSASSVRYVETHPVEPVYLDGAIEIGYVLPADVTIYPIAGDPDYGYVYANDRAYIVSLGDRVVVQSPGYVVTSQVRDYALNHPTASITLEGDIRPGYHMAGDIKLGRVPDSAYSYVYINGHPALVDNATHVVVWIGQ